jgi:tetratricopeptide (TPR) repeat protein
VPHAGTPRLDQALALAALALLVLAQNITPITNNDLFLHLTTGRIILATGSVPRVDDYSALARGRPFIAHEWLAGVVFRLVEVAFGAAGLDALILFKAFVAVGVAAALYAAARVLGASVAAAVSALALVMTLAAARFLERPHISTFLMTALFILVLSRRARGARAPLWPLVPLQTVWTNLHGGFLLGPALVALASGAALVDHLFPEFFSPGGPATPGAERTGPRPAREARAGPREAGRLALLAVALIAACFLNPYGWRLLSFPFDLTGSAFMGTIYEWLPPFSSPFVSTYMVRYYIVWMMIGVGVFAGSVGLAAMGRGRVPGGSFPVLLFGALFVLSLRMNRNVTDFALGTAPGVAATATALLRQGRAERGRDAAATRRSPLPWLAFVLVVLAGWFAHSGYAYSASARRPFGLGLGRNIPVAAADYLKKNGVEGNAFNTYGAGAYLVYRLYPAVRVAMDSRNDVYGETLYDAYTRALADPEALRRTLEQIDAGFILLEWPQEGMARTASVVRQAGGWRPVYFDDAAVVYLREDGRREDLIARDVFDIFDPPLFRPGALAPADAERALREAERAVEQSGGSYVARAMKMDALGALGRRAEALEVERLILEESPPLYHIYIYLGLERLVLGDAREAADRFRRALALNPDSSVARKALEEAAAPR